jgi:hypothetical protein
VALVGVITAIERRRFDAKIKAEVVLERLKGRSVAEICATHQIAQSMCSAPHKPTSESFMKGCSLLGIQQAFTSYNNPKGNADTERMMRTIKEELLWLQEWRGVWDVAIAVRKWCESYNESYLHSARHCTVKHPIL